MRRILIAALACSAMALATPAAADIVRVDASTIQGSNVLFQDDTQVGTSLMGMLNDSRRTRVQFTTDPEGGVLTSFSGGQARISGALDPATNNPGDTLGLTSLLFQLEDGGTFNDLEFNVFGGTATGVNFTLFDDAGTEFNFFSELTNGENFFGFQGVLGQSIASASLTAVGGVIGDVRQIRFDAVNVGAVPEPGTWAMMLIGFGAVGAAMRRSRRKDSKILQLA